MIPLPHPLLAEHSHGVAGADVWMWAIWAGALLVSGWAIWAAVKATFRPGETDPGHVKRSILDDEVPPVVPQSAPQNVPQRGDPQRSGPPTTGVSPS